MDALSPASPAAPALRRARPPSGWRVARRTLRVAWLLARFAWGWRRDLEGPPEGLAARQKVRAEWLREELVDLGPTFVKVGQTLSTRVDLLPVPYVDAMALLQDRVPAFPTALARRFIEEELGRPVDALFADFPDRPLAAASLGQVYRTWLHDGTEVAVKVQRPDLLETFAVDLAAMKALARFGEKHVPGLADRELVDILEEFDRKLHEEIDYRLEAANTDRFRRNFEGYPGVAAPAIHPAYSSRRVLTMAFMHGAKVTDVAFLARHGISAPELVKHAVQVNLKQLLEDGFYHADVHPGNVMVDQDGRLILLDFGLVGEIPASMRAQMVEAFLHAVDLDLDGLVSDLAILGFLRPGQDPAPLKPTLGLVLKQAFTPVAGRPSFKEMTDPVAEIFFRYHLRVPVTFAFIFRTLISLEGIGMQLDPHFHPFDVAIPYAAKLVLSEAGRDLRERFVAEVFKPQGLDYARLRELLALALRDPGFAINEVAAWGAAWLFSDDGASVRARLIAEVLGDRPLPWAEIEALVALAAGQGKLDWTPFLEPALGYLLTPEGRDFRRRLARKLGQDLLAGRLGSWAGAPGVLRALFART